MGDPVAGVTHHIVLDDGTTKLGLMSADEMASFVRIPVSRTSLKTASGDTLYSDLEPPYSSKMQDKFSGGRGQKHLRVDPVKFYDSWNVDTRLEGQCILGPRVYTGTLVGLTVPEYAPGTVADMPVLYHKITQETVTTLSTDMYNDGVNQLKAAQSFLAPTGGGSIASADVWLRTIGGACTLTVEIQSDNGSGLPSGTVLATVNVAIDTTTGWKTATFASPLSVTGGTTYWLVYYTTATTTTRASLVQIYAYSDGRAAQYDGAQWVLYDAQYDLTFRVLFTQIKRAMSFNYAGGGSYTLARVQLYLKKVGTVTPTIRIETNSSSLPSGTLAHANATKTLITSDVSTSYSWVSVDFTDFSLNQGTTYWIVVYDDTQRDQNNALYWGNDGSPAYASGSAASKVGAGAWGADTGRDYYFRINNGASLTNPVYKFVSYKGQLYGLSSPVEGTTAGTLWMNGDRGAADSNSGDKTVLNDATKSWTNNEWVGCVVKITGGLGKGEWRYVISNTATALTVSTTAGGAAVAWTTTQDTTTEYVILGSDKWTDVSPGSGAMIDAYITDCIVANEIMYIACGDGQNILRRREYNSAGTWTTDTADDGTNKATVLIHHKNKIYRATSNNQVSYASEVTWGTDLTFSTAIKVGTSDYPITALLVYDSDVWAGKEDSLWSIKADVPEQIPVDFSSLTSPDNCRRMIKWNVYLFFPLSFGLERLYGLQVDDMGPNRGEGLPSGRQGPVADILPAPGMLYVAIDAGDSGTSSILVYNELGWHEFARATASGARIRALVVQVIPGGPNRLWFSMGTDIAYVRMPAKSINPLKDSHMRYAASGELITSWVDLHLADTEKYFKDLKLVTEYLSAGAQTITVSYQLDDADDDDAWTLINVYNTSPVEESVVGSAITGQRIRFKLAFATNDSTKTPNLEAWVLDSLSRLEPKSRWEPTIKLEDYVVLLNGAKDSNTRADIIDQLDTWSGSATPLTMSTCDPAWPTVTVFIEPVPETQKRYQVESDGGGAMVNGQGKLIVLEA